MPHNLKIGQRVRFVLEYGDYPMTPIPAGKTGTVVIIESDYIGVRMDDFMEELLDWDNVRQVCVIDENGERLPDFDNPAERFLEPIED